jgi:anhydro-N-acetylmuramic acid kinase
VGHERLERAFRKAERLCIGLLSGTSVDAAEAALCRIRGSGSTLALQLVAHVSVPFDPALTERVLALNDPRDVCALDFELGERFAEAALAVVERAGFRPEDVDVIGSHGQTVAHLPPFGSRRGSTLQIGEAGVIAERTGIPVVCDFRVRDVAVGGQGAPLVPYFDWAVLRAPGRHRALQNLGGIGNVSIVGDRLEDTLAFDTGPANMVLDGLARRASAGKLAFDRDGALSGQGSVLPGLLEELLCHPFLARSPPRSAGRDEFGDALIEELWARFGNHPYDLMATAAAFTVEATARAYETFVLPRFPDLDGVWVSGGGSRNPALMNGLRKRLAPLPVDSLSRLGFPEEAREAACFALLASECLSGVPQNVPAATGASRAVVLGKMVP